MATTIVPSIFSSSTIHTSHAIFKTNNIAPFNSKTNLFSSCKLACNYQNSVLQAKVTPFRGWVVANSDFNEAESTSEQNEEATIDVQLPRRSLLVRFTCDACSVRSERLINRLAYERGMVYVQCAGCLKYHKLVDNLGMVIEYNYLEEKTTESDESE